MPSLEIALDSALAEYVYHRAPVDQGFTEAELQGWTSVGVDLSGLPAASFTAASDGFVYGKDNGFAAVVLTRGNDYKIVFRGTDVGSSMFAVLKAGLTGGDTSQVDGGDITADLQFGGGVVSLQSQAADAIR